MRSQKTASRSLWLSTFLTSVTLLVLSVLSPSANAGTASGGGGDPCENRIQEIRDDIHRWINMGGPEKAQLRFGSDGDLSRYTMRMNYVLAVDIDDHGRRLAKTDIECVHHPVKVDDTEKVCRFDRYQNGGKITCYYEAFMDEKTMSQFNQYRLIHHEYAELAGFEQPNGAQSNYELSDQVAARLRASPVMKLSVPEANEASYVCFTIPETHQQFVCSETEMRSALTVIRLAQQDAKARGMTFNEYVRLTAKGMVVAGAVGVVGSYGLLGLEQAGVESARVVVGALSRALGADIYMKAVVFGGAMTIIGGVTLALTPSSTAQSSWTEMLSSVDGLEGAFRSMNDDQILSFARTSPSASQTIMATAAIILKTEYGKVRK